MFRANYNKKKIIKNCNVLSFISFYNVYVRTIKYNILMLSENQSCQIEIDGGIINFYIYYMKNRICNEIYRI